MVVVFLIANLTLAQAGVDVREPMRPYESAPPRAETGTGGAGDQSAPGIGGSGTQDQSSGASSSSGDQNQSTTALGGSGDQGQNAAANGGSGDQDQTAAAIGGGGDQGAVGDQATLPNAADQNAVGFGGSGAELAQPAREMDLTPAQEAGAPKRTVASEAGESQATNDANDRASGTGGAGAANANNAQPTRPLSQAEKENQALRQELQNMTQLLEASRQEAAQTNTQLQSIQQQYTAEQERAQAEKQQVLSQKQARLNALVGARSLLMRIYPDTLHDSTEYANILEQARQQLFRAGQLVPDSATVNAQESLNLARYAFENKDLASTYAAVQQTITNINEAANQGGAAGGLPQY